MSRSSIQDKEELVIAIKQLLTRNAILVGGGRIMAEHQALINAINTNTILQFILHAHSLVPHPHSETHMLHTGNISYKCVFDLSVPSLSTTEFNYLEQNSNFRVFTDIAKIFESINKINNDLGEREFVNGLPNSGVLKNSQRLIYGCEILPQNPFVSKPLPMPAAASPAPAAPTSASSAAASAAAAAASAPATKAAKTAKRAKADPTPQDDLISRVKFFLSKFAGGERITVNDDMILEFDCTYPPSTNMLRHHLDIGKNQLQISKPENGVVLKTITSSEEIIKKMNYLNQEIDYLNSDNKNPNRTPTVFENIRSVTNVVLSPSPAAASARPMSSQQSTDQHPSI